MARRDLSGAVDFGHLETYAGHDAALVDEVLGLFEQQVASWTRLLDPMAPGWRDAAHTLKGSALGVGAFQMAQACDAAEAAGEGAPPRRARAADRGGARRRRRRPAGRGRLSPRPADRRPALPPAVAAAPGAPQMPRPLSWVSTVASWACASASIQPAKAFTWRSRPFDLGNTR